MCNVRITTPITFIFRINTLPFPLCRHISQRGEAHSIFSSCGSSCQNAAFLSPLTLPSAQSLEITPLPCLSAFTPPCLGFFLWQRGEDDGLSTERPSAVRAEVEDEESRFWPVAVCHRLALLQRFPSLGYSPHTVCGVWPPQSIFSMPACLQLVDSDHWLLISLHGVRVRHEPFSSGRTVKLQPTLEKYFQWISVQSLHTKCQQRSKVYQLPFTTVSS